MTRLNRRDVLKISSATILTAIAPRLALADVATGVPLHGLSAFGELKYRQGLYAFRLCQSRGTQGRHIRLLAAELACTTSRRKPSTR